MRGKGEYIAREKEKELDISRFLTTIERVSVGEEERSKMTIGAGNGGRGEGVSVLKHVQGPKITRNSWKSAYMEERLQEKGVSKEGDRSNEVDSLFSVFPTNGRESISRLSNRGFFLILLPST